MTRHRRERWDRLDGETIGPELDPGIVGGFDVCALDRAGALG
jgi:hypothetical protein